MANFDSLRKRGKNERLLIIQITFKNKNNQTVKKNSDLPKVESFFFMVGYLIYIKF